jgi:hypothetical protein
VVKLSDERASFHEFWLWEYQRRNSEYKEIYDNFKKKLSQININYNDVSCLSEKKSSVFSKEDWKLYQHIVDEKKSFIEKFNIEPKDYKEGPNSANLLIDVLSGNEKSLFLSYDIDGISMVTKLVKYNRVNGYTEWPHLTVKLDLTEDLNLLLNEVSYLYHEFHLKKKLDSKEYSERKNIDDVRNWRDESLNKLIKSNKGLIKQGRSKALPKAVGLWLWDQWNKKEKTSKNKAIKKFFKEVTECKNGLFFSDEGKTPLIFIKENNYAYLETNHLNRILSRTTDCIKKMEVLPMK